MDSVEPQRYEHGQTLPSYNHNSPFGTYHNQAPANAHPAREGYGSMRLPDGPPHAAMQSQPSGHGQQHDYSKPQNSYMAFASYDNSPSYPIQQQHQQQGSAPQQARSDVPWQPAPANAEAYQNQHHHMHKPLPQPQQPPQQPLQYHQYQLPNHHYSSQKEGRPPTNLSGSPSCGHPQQHQQHQNSDTSHGYHSYEAIPAPAAGQYSPINHSLPPAGQHRPLDQNAIPRFGRGTYADAGMKDNVILGGYSSNPQGMAPSQPPTPSQLGSPTAARFPMPPTNGWERNVDALETFMTGITGAHTAKDGQPDFSGYYSKAHAGKMTASHLSNAMNGIQSESSHLDGMPHYKQAGQGHQSQLQAHEAAGYVPMDMDHGRGSMSGLRTYPGNSQKQGLLGMTAVGLTAPQVPLKIIAHAGKTSESSMHMTSVGLSSSAPQATGTMLHVYPGKQGSSLEYQEMGLVQGGKAPARVNKFAGMTSKSHFQSGPTGLQVQDSASPAIPSNPHAGKGTASQLIHNAGTLTCMTAGPRRAPAGGQGSWSTTYDDTYATVQTGHVQLQQFQTTQKPTRF